MTKNEAIEKVLNLARAEVGYHEVGDNWNKYADYLDPLGITWGNKQGYAWCGEFVLCMFVQAFGIDKGLQVLCSGKPSGIPLCSAGADYFKNAGRWHEANPQRGDIVFFYYGGGINHTGIVESVGGGVVNTIEGNTSDVVARRTYAHDSPAIAGYGRPRWDVVSDDDSPETPQIEEPTHEKPHEQEVVMNCTIKLPLLRKGDGMGDRRAYRPWVKTVQELLIARGYDLGTWGADGEFGGDTLAAVIKFQTDNNLEADGIIGAQTWAKLLGI